MSDYSTILCQMYMYLVNMICVNHLFFLIYETDFVLFSAGLANSWRQVTPHKLTCDITSPSSCIMTKIIKDTSSMQTEESKSRCSLTLSEMSQSFNKLPSTSDLDYPHLGQNPWTIRFLLQSDLF